MNPSVTHAPLNGHTIFTFSHTHIVFRNSKWRSSANVNGGCQCIVLREHKDCADITVRLVFSHEKSTERPPGHCVIMEEPFAAFSRVTPAPKVVVKTTINDHLLRKETFLDVGKMLSGFLQAVDYILFLNK